jgi:hypothetical protein
VTDRDHEAIQELLAGYALRSLSGEDAAAAERALDEHVPACDDCRRSLDAFDAVAADLALATEPVAPPELLLARLHRDMEPRRRAGRSWNTGKVVAVAASIILVAGVSGLVLSRSSGVGSAELVATNLEAALAAAAEPDAETTAIGPTSEVKAPDGFFLYGRDVPQPPIGQVYRLWLVADGEAYYVDEFLPDLTTGTVAIRVLVEGSFDDVLITIEDASAPPGEPGSPAWQQAA